MTAVLTYVVSLAMWMTPMPQHATGWIVNYGDASIMQFQADYRSYSLSGFLGGVAVMSPADLGKIVWVRTGYHEDWLGPFLAVDTSARKDFYANTHVRNEIIEIDERWAEVLGFQYGTIGEAYVSSCPPDPVTSVAQEYLPPVAIDWWSTNNPEQAFSHLAAYWSMEEGYPAQQLRKADCPARSEYEAVVSRNGR